MIPMGALSPSTKRMAMIMNLKKWDKPAKECN